MASASSNGIWQWTLTPEAIASCFAKDVLDMRESGVKDAEFFWLGRVPCRSVKLAGLVVGVQVYETRIVYSLDDGSAVMECHHRPPAPAKSKTAKPEPPPPLEPLARVGWSVIVIGRISSWRDTRRILVDSIGLPLYPLVRLVLNERRSVRCPSANDEPKHWIAVRNLHKTYYSLDEPFVIPARAASQLPTPTNLEAPIAPATPSSSSTAQSSPVKTPAASTHASPHKLRHPSRLHTNELTDNAFRIYVKHYMDNADDLRPVPPEPTTPTRSSHNRLPLGDETPRPYDRTPQQQRIAPLDFARPLGAESDQPTYGFTLSYLRRVPELALMAKRVVKAEAKRRAREARKKALASGNGAVVVTKTMRNDQGKLHPRMKRLFGWAVLQLVKEGDVISWDSPARPCGGGAQPGPADADTSALWKVNSSTSTAGGNSTVMSSASVAEDDEDEGELTDPEEDEEVFVPLTPVFLATAVEKAIRTLSERAARERSSARVRAPAAGPAVREIVAYLKSDDMWRNLSDFTVKEALALLQDEGRAWMIGADRWELSI
ncbi:hypothetical protein FB451DRAFT_1087 [Mycena latifolia]|nr:hypothetical protein FB451DRAFT_1087 [Mycena latifolia]